ncbi:MAG: PEP-CTERM sorting domain-containing protein [Candidatus Rokubacteria bacterium]|nr:PEP-CTERM sorting domain-containing protein [Candidatus Rokubacteria bacterium]
MEQVIAQVISSTTDLSAGVEDHMYWDNLSVDASPVPEPTTLLLWGTSLLGIAGLRRWRRRSQD